MIIKDGKGKASRQAFGEALAELGTRYPRVVVCEADLSKSTKSELFAKKFPERFFQMGIAEANMIGTGAGLASSGFTPFICSFGAFVSGRYDQIRMSVAYAGANVRVIGTHAGVGIGDDGHSQMGLEDLSLMRELPTMVVLQPADEIETRQMIELLARPDGLAAPAYVRLTRQALKPVHGPEYQWQLGKIDVLHQASGGARGSQLAVLATGAAVQEAAMAADRLASQGFDVTVVNVPTIKPFDAAGVESIAKAHRVLITVEDHYTTGGLGSAVAETLADAAGKRLDQVPRLIRLGVNDAFGESGEPDELYEKFGLSANRIAATIVEAAG
jgi:transketolase